MSESRFPHPTGANSPVPLQRLKQIANDACFAALEKVEVYDHSRTEGWNNTIINHILRTLISESTPTGAGPGSSPYKFSVNSTIIQHMAQRNSNYLTSTSTSAPSAAATTSTSQDPASPVSPAAAASAAVGSELTSGRASNENTGVGRRGMHSACGAYWNNEKDGMWSFKYETRGIAPQHCLKTAYSGGRGVGSAGNNKVCAGLTGCCGKGLDVVISVIWIAV